MGVPHFCKWLAIKYQSCFIKKKIEEKIDILALDNNGLIHPLTAHVLEEYPEWDDLDILEKRMCNDIIEYMKKVYNECKAEYFYISIDGPVPMAKVNQQRLRRFKAITEKKIIDDIKILHKKKVPNYWPNANITPGTKFMEKLNVRIKQSIKKNNFDKAICIFSPSDVAGEGEHKIFGYLRKNKDLFKDKVKVIYGLDADLIFLSLASGFKKIFLMREYTELDRLGSNEFFFNYIDIDMVRNCVVKEMCFDNKLTQSDNNKIFEELNNETKQSFINDFIFITFLIGNDFLPNIWSLDVMHRGEDKILIAWKTCFAKLNDSKKSQFIVNKSDNTVNINFIFFNMFINVLSLGENYYYSQEIFTFINKESKMSCRSPDQYSVDMFNHQHMKKCEIYNPDNIGKGQIKFWKEHYYEYYFFDTSDKKNFNQNVNKICYKYIEGLQWIIHYYFNNEPISWTWFYAFLSSPLLIDLNNYLNNDNNEIKFNFKSGEPLKPYVQCLAVLPPQLSQLLVKELRFLVTDKKSKIIRMFPESFMEDRIHKTLAYKCCPIIPPINIESVQKEIDKISFKEPEMHKTIRYDPNSS